MGKLRLPMPPVGQPLFGRRRDFDLPLSDAQTPFCKKVDRFGIGHALLLEHAGGQDGLIVVRQDRADALENEKWLNCGI